jgi:hypothetical protein
LYNIIVPLLRKKIRPRVFCIGYLKTGTTSLYSALRILGYRTIRSPYWNIWKKQDFDLYVKHLKNSNYDAFVDYPIGNEDLYKLIDKQIPNSKFILTIRNRESFGKSYTNYFKNTHREIVNSEQLDEVLTKYELRNNQVIDYFKDKPDQLLVMNTIEGDGWEKLCNFLDKPIPQIPYPHKNIGKYRKKE